MPMSSVLFGCASEEITIKLFPSGHFFLDHVDLLGHLTA